MVSYNYKVVERVEYKKLSYARKMVTKNVDEKF